MLLGHIDPTVTFTSDFLTPKVNMFILVQKSVIDKSLVKFH